MEETLPARSTELQTVLEVLSDLADGGGSVLLVSGPAGAGKTTLLRTALAHMHGVRNLSGRAYRFQTPVAFGPVIEAFGPSLRSTSEVESFASDLHSLVWLFDGLPVVPPSHTDASLQRPRLLHSLHTLIHRMATAGPVALTIDDAQWADDATIEFLSLLADSLSDIPVALLLAERSDDPDSNRAATGLFNRLRRDGGGQVILGPLDLAGVTEVAAAALGGGQIQPGLLRMLHDRTGGTPLFLIEALNQMRERSDITQVGSVWQFTGTRIPKSAYGPDLMADRLLGSTDDERKILEMLALNGEPLAESNLVSLGADTSRLGLMVRRRLIIEVVDAGIPRWSLEHPVLADIIVESLTTTDRQARHERLARLFMASDVGRFAHHLLGSGERAVRVAGSEGGVCAALCRAGELAERGHDLIEATDLLTAALGWLNVARPSSDDAAITASLARVWAARGQHGTAQQLASEALDEFVSVGNLDGALEVAATLSNAMFLGDVADVEWLDRLADHVEAHGTDFQRLVARFQQLTTLSRLGGRRTSKPDPWKTLEALRTSNDVATGRHARLIVATLGSDLPQDLQNLQATYRDLCTEPGLIESCRAVGWHGLIDVAMARGAWTTSEQLERDYLDWLASTGIPQTWRLAVFRWNRLIARGDLGAALQIEFDFRYAAALNPRVVALRAYQRILTHDAAGDLGSLVDADLVQAIVNCLGSDDIGARFYVESAHLIRVALLDDLEAVASARRPELRLCDGAPLAAFVANALADLALGNSDGVQRVTDALRVLDPRALDLPGALADRFDGEMKLRVGDRAGAAELLRRAHDWFIGNDLPVEAARTALLLEPFVPLADETLVELEERMRELDVTIRADQLAKALYLRGVSTNQKGSVSDRPSDWLSKREREVAELVMDGLTNREVADQLFISIRTVTSHLDHIYTKLGVASRRNLAPVLRDERADERRAARPARPTS